MSAIPNVIDRLVQTTAKAFAGQSVTQEQIDANIKAFNSSRAKARQGYLEAKADAAKARQSHKLKYVYDPETGVTIAYSEEEPWKRIVTFSTSLCSKDDVYSEKLGRMYAAANFARGKTVQLRRPKSMPVDSFLMAIATTENDMTPHLEEGKSSFATALGAMMKQAREIAEKTKSFAMAKK